MTKKFYAVKAGKVAGIYESWEKCKENVIGYPKAKYKSFATVQEAEDYIAGREAAGSDPVTGEGEMAAYIDGSYDHDIKRYGWSAVVFTPEGRSEFSGAGEEPELIGMRNVAGELTAAMRVMDMAVSQGKSKVTIYYDYNGIEKWAKGAWKTNLDFTRAYAAYARDVMCRTKLEFVKVKAHTGDARNGEADALAKKALLGPTAGE